MRGLVVFHHIMGAMLFIMTLSILYLGVLCFLRELSKLKVRRKYFSDEQWAAMKDKAGAK